MYTIMDMDTEEAMDTIKWTMCQNIWKCFGLAEIELVIERGKANESGMPLGEQKFYILQNTFPSFIPFNNDTTWQSFNLIGLKLFVIFSQDSACAKQK